MKYFIKTRPHDNSVVWIRKAEDVELFHREQVLDVDDIFDLPKYLLEQCNGGEPNLFFVDGKLEIRQEEPKAHTIKKLHPQIRAIQSALYLPYLFREVVETGGDFKDINRLRIEREEIHGNLQTQRGLLTEEEKKSFEAAVNKAAKDRMSQADYIYDNVIVATAKDETPYLIEWITYHLDLGVEHIFIRDDDSETPIKETLSELPQEYLSKVTINEKRTPHPYTPQRVWYGNWLREWEGKVKWVCFLDIDEFITINDNIQLKDFLASFSEDVGEINMGWVEYNAGSQLTKEAGTVRERFKEISPATPFKKGYWLGKYFVRPEVVERIRIHECELSKGFKRVSPNGKEVKVLDVGAFADNGYNEPSEQPVHINHYFTKSKEEWFEKIKRGACDNYLRRTRDFYIHNPDVENTEEIQKLN